MKSLSRRLHESPAAGPGPAPAAPLPDFSRWGEIEVEPFSNVRRITAQRMAASWSAIPHVTQFDQADITGLEAWRKGYAPEVEKAGAKLTPTAVLLKVAAAALRAFPAFNASIDMAGERIIFKNYVHIGVAVDTPRGLLVPVIRDVDRKSVTEISVELGAMAERTRTGKVDLADLEGGTFTVSNLGGLGGTAFTPIINAPEVAILGAARSRTEPVYVDGDLQPRLILPLSLSYDHRLIDGADGVRFCATSARAWKTPSSSPSRPDPMAERTQVAVIGGGPGGYVAAFRAADLGLQVTLIDPEGRPGGVCLYRGCIPSKALLHVARLLSEAREAEEWGVSFGEPRIDLDKLRAHRDRVVAHMSGGLGQLTRARGVTLVRGLARLTGPQSLRVEGGGGSPREIGFEHAVLATGSRPIALPAFDAGSDRVMDSTGALELADVPGRLLVVGGGIVGLELGQVYAALGSRVTVVEMTDGLIPGADRDLVRVLQKQLEEQFEAIHLECAVTAAAETSGGLEVTREPAAGGPAETGTWDRVLLSVGRRPNTEDLGLESTRAALDPKGFVGGRRPAPHRGAVDLRRRRRHRLGPGPHRFPRGRGRRGGHRRPARRLRAQRHPQRRLHRPRGRLVRPHRVRGPGAGSRGGGRALPLDRLGPRRHPRPRRRPHQAGRPARHRADPRGRRGRSGRRRADRRGRPGRGDGRGGAGPGPLHPPPPHPLRDPDGSGRGLPRPQPPRHHEVAPHPCRLAHPPVETVASAER